MHWTNSNIEIVCAIRLPHIAARERSARCKLPAASAVPRRNASAPCLGAMPRRDASAQCLGAMPRRHASAQYIGAMTLRNASAQCLGAMPQRSSLVGSEPSSRHPANRKGGRFRTLLEAQEPTQERGSEPSTRHKAKLPAKLPGEAARRSCHAKMSSEAAGRRSQAMLSEPRAAKAACCLSCLLEAPPQSLFQLAWWGRLGRHGGTPNWRAFPAAVAPHLRRLALRLWLVGVWFRTLFEAQLLSKDGSEPSSRHRRSRDRSES